MSPSILFSLTVATCYGCAFHALFGRRLWQWPLFWLAGLAGFFLGYIAGVAAGFELLRIGSVPMAAATLGSFAALVLAWYFTFPWADDTQTAERPASRE
jgi:predicted membrane-bound dolichyl-phosphate-mannose-protein mannosyltransferase